MFIYKYKVDLNVRLVVQLMCCIKLKVKLKQSNYRPEQALKVPES
jgi:hypothetical protein